MTAGELIGSILAPGDDPNVMVKALDTLERSAWYLHADARGYRFSTEINLNKLIEDATREVSVQKTKQRATQILAEQFKDSTLKVRRAWEDAKVPDRAEDAWLVILHWDDFPDAHGVEPGADAPGRVLDLFERTPAGGLREFRNRLVILVPTQDTHETMLAAVRRHLALSQLSGNSDTLAQLSPEKKTRARRARQGVGARGADRGLQPRQPALRSAGGEPARAGRARRRHPGEPQAQPDRGDRRAAAGDGEDARRRRQDARSRLREEQARQPARRRRSRPPGSSRRSPGEPTSRWCSTRRS